MSTYPGVTAVLGELRRTGRLKVPVYSSITDLAGMQFWAHPGVDLHFVTHPETIEEVEGIAGPGSVRWAKPPTSPSFLAARSRDDARRALGLPTNDTKVIAVSGGGWGVGDLLGATRAALQVPDAIVLCLCGRNDKLRARVTRELGSEPRLRIMGFTDRMGDVLAASDALVHSSAGLTVLEAIIRGCPVISYGFGYGHVRVSNLALERFGLAQVAPKVTDIGPALGRALEHRPEPDGRFARRPSTASLILGDERRAQPLPTWRVRTTRAILGGAAVLIVASWTLTAGASYSLVSDFVHMRPVTRSRRAAPRSASSSTRRPAKFPAWRPTSPSGGSAPRSRSLSPMTPRTRWWSPTAMRPCRAFQTADSCAGWTRVESCTTYSPRWASATTSCTHPAGRAWASGGWPTAPAAGLWPARYASRTRTTTSDGCTPAK